LARCALNKKEGTEKDSKQITTLLSKRYGALYLSQSAWNRTSEKHKKPCPMGNWISISLL